MKVLIVTAGHRDCLKTLLQPAGADIRTQDNSYLGLRQLAECLGSPVLLRVSEVLDLYLIQGVLPVWNGNILDPLIRIFRSRRATARLC